ncbi:MinD-like ATPase involved in chromosome partitioning or flagellar assembly [Micromonospora cremea]|uniref:MinD-like ATPase involved in chromosome partitioning or flagellar assembly n=1 Tax=Micromonospora cremea TaxID=709881 RepID=A0A1N5YIP2_9ACTN|nr:MinD-like ATPase involved in chromosome partitioning or flagellar assembly [Micromonospora cremea]
MEGSETGWGRPAEPAPRWRALLDRARHGARAPEQAEPDRRADEPPPDPLPRRAAPNGNAGRASAIGHPAELSYGADPGYRAEASYRVDPAYRAEPAYRPEPDYRGEPGYRGEPAYRAEPVYRAEPDYRAEPAYRAEPDHRAEPAYRAEPEPERPSRRAEPVESRYSLLDNGYRHGSPPAESRYALLETGYQPETGYPPPAASRVAPPPAASRVAPPPAAPRVTPPPAARVAPPAAPRVTPPAVPPVTPPPAPPVSSAIAERGFPPRVEWRPQGVDQELERATGVLRRDLGTPRVFAFANPKGGVHKTTATVLAAATVGSVRGRGVLAWDDNELRGTLGLRAGSARHARTIRHLIGELAQIEILEGSTLLERLDDFLRHASDGSYDVLAGEESPRFAQRLDQFTVRRVLELLRRTHDVVCVDTGNNVESANWRTVMQAADQLVVTTVPREDAAFSADWMLDLLHEEGMGELADNAITLISCPTPGRSALQDDLERHFATRTRAVAVVPYDPALETGSSIEYHQLQPETRQAWLRAASVMVEPFAR